MTSEVREVTTVPHRLLRLWVKMERRPEGRSLPGCMKRMQSLKRPGGGAEENEEGDGEEGRERGVEGRGEEEGGEGVEVDFRLRGVGGVERMVRKEGRLRDCGATFCESSSSTSEKSQSLMGGVVERRKR